MRRFPLYYTTSQKVSGIFLTVISTGSEVTPFAVVTDDATGQKCPIADYELTPNMAIVDPA